MGENICKKAYPRRDQYTKYTKHSYKATAKQTNKQKNMPPKPEDGK